MKVTWPALKSFIDHKQVYPQILEDTETLHLIYVEGTLIITCEIIKSLHREYYADFEDNYRSLSNQPVQTKLASLPEQQPFSLPTYRTKIHATNGPITCDPGQTTAVDFIMPEEMYAQGGEIYAYYAQFGDNLSAEIYDVNGVIPEPYRAAVSEAYPSVSKYIVKAYVRITTAGYGHVVLDTRPLVAKITQGLSMRISYTATAEGDARSLIANYFLNKKLPGVSDT